MIRDEDDFLMTVEELSALAAGFSAGPGPLSLLPPGEPSLEDRKAAAAGLKKLSPQERESLQKSVLTLANPESAAHFHHAVSDQAVTRSVLAWPQNGLGDEIVCVTRLGKNRRISLRSAWEVGSVLSRTLAAGQGLKEQNFGCRLTSLAVLALLGIFDQLQYARLYSMLVHASPLDSAAPDEVFQRLAESELEDFRWILPFLEKTLPSGALTSISVEEVRSALAELAKAGLLEAVDAGGSLYQLTGSGQFAADAAFHNLSRAAVCTSRVRPDGMVGYDCMLFLRGPAGLFFYNITGAEGAVLALSQPALEELLETIFSRSKPATPKPATLHPAGAQKSDSPPPPPEKLIRKNPPK
jgi:hypothetical protein